jgi:hypothetical protein
MTSEGTLFVPRGDAGILAFVLIKHKNINKEEI